ncbi:MAG: hypothetical protein PHN75_12120 [Syntrophales bacterium]|nr:hypothetical protein [Syntrophales bacterium]
MKFDFLGSVSKLLKSRKKRDLSPPNLQKERTSPVKQLFNDVSTGGGGTHAPVTGREISQIPKESISQTSPVKQIPSDDLSFHGNIGTVSAPQSQVASPVTGLQEIRSHPDISSSMRALGNKYALYEITIATDDGLVLATSASRDVEFDAVHYSQVVQLNTSPSEPDVTLFEVNHKGSRLIGIIRATRHISPVMIEQVRDDTKVILQWWL